MESCKTYTWNYRDRLTSSGDGLATSTYGYDHLNQRVLKVIGTATTTYPNMYFNTVGATSTAHIFLPDGRLVATIEGNGVSTTTSYIHPDHLGSTSVVTDGNGDVVQTLDYYPFGDPRIKSGTDLSQREYIGQEYDEESELSYLNARYYEGSRGQFLSQDPMFLGDPKKQDLVNPQNLNSYSYAVNNPIRYKDPDGKYVEVSISGTYMGWSGSAGFRVSTGGLNIFGAGGFGAGLAGYPISVSYTPGDVPHTVETTVNVGGSAAYYVGGGASVGGKYVPQTYSLDNPQTQYSVNLGIGADVYVRKEVSIPILGGKAPAGLVLSPGSPYSTPNYVPAPVQKSTQYISSPSSANRTYISAPSSASYIQQLYTTPNGKTIDWYGSFVSTPSTQTKK